MTKFDAFVSIRIVFFELNICNIDCCKQAFLSCSNACCFYTSQFQTRSFIVKLIKDIIFFE